MPAHIFVQLGLWAEAEASDRDAFAASDAWVKRKGLPPAMRSYHSLAWRQYELLQLGRFNDSLRAIDEIAPVVKATGDVRLLSDQSSMRARYVVETRRWNVMANERNFGNVNELCAIGFSAARLHNPTLAELARQALAARSQAKEEGDLRPAIAIMERQVAALIELEAGRRDQAVAILKAATEAELKLPPPLGLPIPIKPAPELLGEVLLELGRPGEALEPFGQALARNANRTLSVLGLARASSALGRSDEASRHYRALLANYERADAELPEIAEAREGDGHGLRYTGRVPIGAAAMAIAIAAVVGLGCRGIAGAKPHAGGSKKRRETEKAKARKRPVDCRKGARMSSCRPDRDPDPDPDPCLERVAEAQLPDPHEPGLLRKLAEGGRVDGVVVDAAELDRVGQVQDLEPDLSDVVAEHRRVLGDHQVDVLAELIPGVAVGTRGVAEGTRSGVGEGAAVEVPGVLVALVHHPVGVAPVGVRIADQVRALPPAEEPEVGLGRAG